MSTKTKLLISYLSRSVIEPYTRFDEKWCTNLFRLISQRLWNVETGRLVMSGTQEGLIRLKSNKL